MLLLLLACRSPDAPAPTETADTAAPEPDEAAVVYDPAVMHELALTMDPADWDSLRHQSRSYVSLLGGDCLAQPFESPYTYFPAEGTFDGEALGPVGLRKKGLIGSLSTSRPSLRVDTDYSVDGARFHDLEHLVFNNNNQDLSRMRTCLAHGLFADAGLVAPRCALAHVTMNGEDLGLYDNTEAIDEELVQRIRGEEPVTMYEGTLSDFRPEWLNTFDPKNEASDGADLRAVSDVLETASDDDLLAELDPLVDVDGFFTFWAAESLAGHWDGHNGNTNNFYVYRDADDDKLRFIASGPDATFDSEEPFGQGQPAWVATTSALANRLIQVPEAKDRYEATLQGLLDTTWDGDRRSAQVDAWKDLARDFMTADERRAVNDLRDIVEGKAALIEDQIGGRVTPADLRGDICFSEIGHVTVSFTTTFGSYPSGDLYAGGTATTSWEINGATYPSVQDGVSAGWVDDDQALFLAISEIATDTWLAAYVQYTGAELTDGVTFSLTDGPAQGQLLYNSPDTGGQWTTAAYLGAGDLAFETAGSGSGAVLVGVLDVGVLG